MIDNITAMYLTNFTHTSLRISRLLTLLIAFVVIAVVTVGCQKKRDLTPISGRVLYEGKPLSHGVVSFQPESGQPSFGTIQSDGTFQLTCRGEGNGATVGKNRIRITCYEQNQKAAKGQGDFIYGKPLIPKKYLSCQTSGLEVDVRPGANEPIILNLTNK